VEATLKTTGDHDGLPYADQVAGAAHDIEGADVQMHAVGDEAEPREAMGDGGESPADRPRVGHERER
jgi:hypothetical protein